MSRCGFSGKLGELINHLRNNPSHWHVRCQECGDSLVTKKDFVNHEQKTGHAPVGVEISDITNVQKTTRVKDTVKGPTKNKLIRLGFSDESASFLATGRNWTTLIGMSKGATTKLTRKLTDEEKEQFYELVRPDLTKNQPKSSNKKQSKSGTNNESFTDSTIAQKLLKKLGSFGWMAGENTSYQIVGITMSNFKGFRHSSENPTRVPIRPVTLVYGPNNGGKSSILKGFASIPQTISTRRSLDGDYDWTPDGPWFNLGGIPQILNNLEEAKFSIGFVIKLSRDEKDDTFKEIRYTYRFDSTASEKNIGILDKIRIYNGEFSDFMELTLELSVAEGKSTQIQFVRSRFLGDFMPVGQENKKLEVTFMNQELTESVEKSKKFRSHLVFEIERFRKILQDLYDEDWLLHSSMNKFSCPYCPKTFNKEKKATNHLSTHHSEELDKKGLQNPSKDVLKEMVENKMRVFTKNTKLTHTLREFLHSSPESYLDHDKEWSSTFLKTVHDWVLCLKKLEEYGLENREGWQDAIKDYQVSEEFDLRGKIMETGNLRRLLSTGIVSDAKIYAKWGLTVDTNQTMGDNEFLLELNSVRRITKKIIHDGFLKPIILVRQD